jgi:hypothetical protein
LTHAARMAPGHVMVTLEQTVMLTHALRCHPLRSMWQLLWNYSRDVAFLRAVFLAAQPRTGPSSTVLVTDVPGLAYGTPTQRVRAGGGGAGERWRQLVITVVVAPAAVVAAAALIEDSTGLVASGSQTCGIAWAAGCCMCMWGALTDLCTATMTWRQTNAHAQLGCVFTLH